LAVVAEGVEERETLGEISSVLIFDPGDFFRGGGNFGLLFWRKGLVIGEEVAVIFEVNNRNSLEAVGSAKGSANDLFAFAGNDLPIFFVGRFLNLAKFDSAGGKVFAFKLGTGGAKLLQHISFLRVDPKSRSLARLSTFRSY
jgi:hypothetical protein